MLEIIIATNNQYKFRELTSLLAVAGIRWRSLAECPAVRPADETGRSFDANAVKKARAAARATGCVALADDSGLEVKALRWGPGVRSARFAGAHGDDEANNQQLLRALEGIPPGKRVARYRCSLALAGPRRVVAITRGTWTGRIAERSAGRRGFGYDPIFLVARFGKTVGQLPEAVKRRLSHRARAAQSMRFILRELVRHHRATEAPQKHRGRR